MNKRQRWKRFKKSTTIKGIKCYTYRGVDDKGNFICLGFTAKPKQKLCAAYCYKDIKEVILFHGKSTYLMLDTFNYNYNYMKNYV